MLQASYIHGFERKKFHAYGVELHPLTLGHAHLLYMAGVAAITHEGDEKSLTLDDVGKIVAICCFPCWEQALDVVNKIDVPGDLFNQIEKSGEQTRDALSTVAEYLVYYLLSPKTNDEQLSVDNVRVPWPWAYAEFLQTIIGRNEAEAWGTICCDAFSYYTCYRVRNGDKDVLSRGELRFLEISTEGKSIEDIQRELNA